MRLYTSDANQSWERGFALKLERLGLQAVCGVTLLGQQAF